MKICVHRETGEEFAVKIIRNKNEAQESAENEFFILQQLNHENIVRPHELIKTEKDLFIVMELVRGDELLSKLCNDGKFEERLSRKLFKQVLKALKHMKDRGVCHRDIKPNNILIIDGKEEVKIMDFNISKFC